VEGRHGSDVVPDYPSPAYGHTPLVPSAQFHASMVTPPLHGHDDRHHHQHWPVSAARHVHTPPVHGSDRCACDHSTPVPGHAPQHQFTPEQFARDEGSRVTTSSQASGQLDVTSAPGNNETSRWHAGSTDATK